jgi:hypothetical protein
MPVTTLHAFNTKSFAKKIVLASDGSELWYVLVYGTRGT